jgi:hypothetical protein
MFSLLARQCISLTFTVWPHNLFRKRFKALFTYQIAGRFVSHFIIVGYASLDQPTLSCILPAWERRLEMTRSAYLGVCGKSLQKLHVVSNCLPHWPHFLYFCTTEAPVLIFLAEGFFAVHSEALLFVPEATGIAAFKINSAF